MLLLAEDEEDAGARMSNEQVRDEVMTLFLAGHETTANLLAWTWYLLSQHPEVEARLHAELDAVLAGGRLPTVEDIPALRYTEMVVAETMRLYPPAWTVGRLAIEDHEVGGYLIPKGSLVLLSQYVVHRDPRFFPDPERFDPERFTPGSERGATAVRLLPLRRRRAPLHRRGLRLDGGHARRRHARAPLAHAPRPRPHRTARAAHHPATEQRRRGDDTQEP